MPVIPQMSQRNWASARETGGLHPGLAFYRFLEDREGQFLEGLRVITRRTLLPFAGDLLRRQQEVITFLQRNGWATCSFHARLLSRLALGLGLPNRTENGLWLDQTHGLPLIPGSVLKGVSQDYALQLKRGGSLPAVFRQDPELTALFGAQTPEIPDRFFQARQGHVIFFEALPVLRERDNPFDLDIINPHYQPYYAEGQPPADYYSPVPNVFLTVQPGTGYHFALAARKAEFTWKDPAGQEHHCHIAASDLLGRALTYVKGALTHVGVGAKTSLGYGRFIIQEGRQADRP